MTRTMVATVLFAVTVTGWAQGVPPVSFDQYVSFWYRLWDATKAAGVDPAALMLHPNNSQTDTQRAVSLKLRPYGVQWRQFRVNAPATWGKTVAAWSSVLGTPRLWIDQAFVGNGKAEAVWYFPPPLHIGLALRGEWGGDAEGNAALTRMREGKPVFAAAAAPEEDAQIPTP